MITSSGQGTFRRNAVLPLLVFLSALTHTAAGIGGILDPPQSPLLTSLQVALVIGQGVALLFRWAAPVQVLAGVVLLHCGLLATSGAELGIGTLAVMLAAFHLTRRLDRRTALRAITGLAILSTVVGFFAALTAERLPLAAVCGVVAVRLLIEYLIPALAGEYARSRSQLRDVAREREHFAERERAHVQDQNRRAERTELARELHDIAGHHLSGIIVTAQAARALIDTDPGRSRSMLHELEQEARATMMDLRGAVGLLRPDDTTSGTDGERTTIGIPGLDDLPALIDAARARGQTVALTVMGEPSVLGPIAEATMYRMVQESLSNAARHAPGTTCVVSIEYRPEGVLASVDNAAPIKDPTRRHVPTRASGTRGYGLVGMNERAELISADLTTGPTADGGWRNKLRVPYSAAGRR